MNILENDILNLQNLYKNSPDRVRKIKLTESEAQKQYIKYVRFVKAFAPTKAKLLDVGCGSGWSTYFLSKEGFLATGIDLHNDGYEPSPSERLNFISGDILSLPFEDESFDVTTTNECLEHVPDPQKALSEMVRVTRPGGLIIILGPNLLSFGMTFKALTQYVWQQRPLKRFFFRDPDMPRHPLGNTFFEVIYFLIRNLFLILKKKLSSQPSFTMRVPDLNPPFHADNDSCYLLNPIDLQKYFSSDEKFEILKCGALNRPESVYLLASGTWFCVKKKP